MSANSRQYIIALFGFDRAIHNVPTEKWDASSPCEGWTVRDVAGHVLAGITNIAARLGRCEEVDGFAEPGKLFGGDPLAAWPMVRNRTLAALDQPGVLQQSFDTHIGTLTMDELLKTMTGDACVHTWDIARGAGIDERLDPDLVDILIDVYRLRHERGLLRNTGRYADEIALDGGTSPQDRLLAFVGRKP